jgi:hypothetical protein
VAATLAATAHPSVLPCSAKPCTRPCIIIIIIVIRPRLLPHRHTLFCACELTLTRVTMLDSQGLAAVSCRDFFDPAFENYLLQALCRIADIPDDVRARILLKSYGSVVLFLGVETVPRLRMRQQD